jgi:hypothetical protein
VDFNGDGMLDVAVGSPSGLVALRGLGNGRFTPSFEYKPSDPSNSLYVGPIVSADFNNDGKPDLAAVVGGVSANFNGTTWIDILRGRGDGTFEPPLSIPAPAGAQVFSPPTSYPVGAVSLSMAAADLNGDGIQDLAVASLSNNGTGGGRVLFGKGDGSFSLAIPVSLPRSGNTIAFAVAAGDFNGNGTSDLAQLVLHNPARDRRRQW